MSTKHSIWTQVLRISVGCLLTAGMAFGQGIEKGQVEATGQLGLVGGIGTHGSFGASIGSAVTDRIIALGEVSYIPLGSSSFTSLGLTTKASANAIDVNATGHYQFQKKGSIVPYAGGGIGVLHASASSSTNIQNVNIGSFSFSSGGSSTDFYVNLGGGLRYYSAGKWGFRPELMIFAGSNTFVRLSVGIFYHLK